MNDAPSQAETEAPGVTESAAAWLDAVRNACADGLEIAALEVRLAAVRVGLLAAGCVIAGLLAASAWLFIVGSLAAVAVAAGVTLPAAMAGAAAVNLAILWLLCAWLARVARSLGFEATRRVVAGDPPSRAAPQARPS